MLHSSYTDRDFRAFKRRQRKFRGARHVLALVGTLMLAAGFLGGASERAMALLSSPNSVAEPASVALLPLAEDMDALARIETSSSASLLHGPSPTAKSHGDWREDFGASQVSSTPQAGWSVERVRRGDNLGRIFQRLGIDAAQLEAVMSLETAHKALRELHPRDELHYMRDSQGNLQGLSYRFSEAEVIEIARDGEHFKESVKTTPLETRVTVSSGEIDSSLFEAAGRAGLADRMTLELANIFAYDIDFALDLREGDRFAVVYEEIYRDGKKLRDGQILAAEFTNVGKTYRAVRFTDAKGHSSFYAPSGKGLRKAFIRTPVDFVRISSYFTPRRFHPVLNRIRAHKGVDYAAPQGTPVWATGDGKVAFMGKKGGYGNVVILQHGNQYSTLYGHLAGFARGLRQGASVSQGQTIGYVGKTGLATGPHLHYEFRVNDVHRNPLTVSLPDSMPLTGGDMAAFKRATQPWVAKLNEASLEAVAQRN